MSTSSSTRYEVHHDAFRADTAAAASASGSHLTITPPKRERSPYLDVPNFRRSSLDSTFSGSDISELSFSHVDNGHGAPLLRSSSTDSAASARRGKFRQALHNFWTESYGAGLVVISMFFGSLMNLCTSLLEHSLSPRGGMHPFQILFVRQSITATLCITWALYTKSIPDFPLGPKDARIRLLLVARGMCGFFGVFGMYYSLLYLPLAEATVLTFLAPILTCYLCSWVIPGEGQGFGRQQQIAAFISLVGVVFIAQPATLFASHTPPSHSTTTTTITPANTTAPTTTTTTTTPTPSQHLNAILCAMLGVLGATGAMTSIRAIGTRAHPFLSINYFSVWCSVVSLACLVIFPSVSFRLPADGREWTLLASLGVCGFVMQWLLTAGLSYGSGGEGGARVGAAADDDLEDTAAPTTASKRGEARGTGGRIRGSGTRATSMVYTQMLFALAADKLVFGVSPTPMSWVGTGLILAGAVWVAAARDGGKGAGKKEGMAVELVVPRMRWNVRRGERGERGEERGKGEERVRLMSGGKDDDEEEEEEEEEVGREGTPSIYERTRQP